MSTPLQLLGFNISRNREEVSKRYEKDTTMNHDEVEEAISKDNQYKLSQSGYLELMETHGGVLIRLGKGSTVYRVKPTSKVIGYSNVAVLAKLEDRQYSSEEMDTIINQALGSDELVGYRTNYYGRGTQISISGNKSIRGNVKVTLDDLSSLCELHGEIHIHDVSKYIEESKLKFPHLKDIIDVWFIPGDNNLIIQQNTARITESFGKIIKYRLKKHHGGYKAVRKKNPKLKLKQDIIRGIIHIIGNLEGLLRNGSTYTIWYKTSGDLDAITCFTGNIDTIRCILIGNTGKNTHTDKQDKEYITQIKSLIYDINQLKIRSLDKVKMGKYVTPDHMKELYKAFDKIKEFGVEGKKK